MNTFRLALLLAVAGLYGCSDTDTVSSSEDRTAQPASTAQSADELVQTLKQGAAAAGESASASLDQAAEQVADAADAAQQAGSRALQQVQSDAADAAAAVADAGRSAVDQVAASAAGVQDSTEQTVETAGLEAAAAGDSLDSEAMATGKAVYAKHCMACHAAGVAGAPRTSDAAAWEPRIAQGMETLYDHAINGFKGSKGFMPAKGGFATLKDDEVKAAVTYMVSASQ